jgi:hypothetical protein
MRRFYNEILPHKGDDEEEYPSRQGYREPGEAENRDFRHLVNITSEPVP